MTGTLWTVTVVLRMTQLFLQGLEVRRVNKIEIDYPPVPPKENLE